MQANSFQKSIIEALDMTNQNQINIPGQAPCIGSMPPDLYHPFNESALAWSDDEETADGWDRSNTFFFKKHLLNIAIFTTITELPAPLTPISKATYEDLGYSYLEIHNESPMRQKEEHGGRRRTGRAQVAGAVAEIGTKGAKKRRTFVSRNSKTKKRQSPDAVIDEPIPGGEAGVQGWDTLKHPWCGVVNFFLRLEWVYAHQLRVSKKVAGIWDVKKKLCC